MGHKLDAREYKLLLDPAALAESSSLDAVNHFWRQRLQPVLAARLHRRGKGRRRWSGKFKAPMKRIVRYWDTADCTLTRADFCLRTRVEAADAPSEPAPAQITLKLRMTDFFVVASMRLPGAGRSRQKFEEDIAPLEVAPGGAAAAVVLPARRSVRSRWARSCDQEHRWPLPSPSLAALMTLYPTLGGYLEDPSGAASDQWLQGGPVVHEFAFEGPKLRLGGGITGGLTLTIWHFETSASPPAVVEISFKCATIDGSMSGKAAGRALSLFEGLQTELKDCVNLAYSSKTALALPMACKRLA